MATFTLKDVDDNIRRLLAKANATPDEDKKNALHQAIDMWLDKRNERMKEIVTHDDD